MAAAAAAVNKPASVLTKLAVATTPRKQRPPPTAMTTPTSIKNLKVSPLFSNPQKAYKLEKILKGVKAGCFVCIKEYENGHPVGRHGKHSVYCPRNKDYVPGSVPGSMPGAVPGPRKISTSGAPSPLMLLQRQSVPALSPPPPVVVAPPPPPPQIIPEEPPSPPSTLPPKKSVESADYDTSMPPPASLFHFKSVEPRARNKLQVKALQNDDMLDMYTYHLGREGLELGDELDPTDTGCSVPPRTKYLIYVEFPLGEGEVWKEQVEWDLENENTLTPLAFATKIAQDFGLNFEATMELVASVQHQLDAHRGDSAYPERVITLTDPATGRARPNLASNKSRPCHFYGSADGPGGIPMIYKKVAKLPPPPVTTASQPPTTAKIGGKPRAEDIEFQFKTPQVFRNEVVKRAKEECQFVSSVLQLKWNHVCHLCSTKKQQGAMFACENPTHVYCHEHCQSELKLELTVGKPTLDYCPICCSSCSCLKCKKRLDQVANELQRRSVAQGGSKPEDTKLDQILMYCAGKFQPTRKSGSGGGGKSFVSKIKVVPKVPQADFPREMCGARDLEPGTDMDYRTVFTDHGPYLLKSNDPSFAANATTDNTTMAAPAVVQEDGNVDYCQICRKVGNIVCCDYCPRAFHEACMEKSTIKGGEGGKWECPSCLREKQGLPEDLVTGKAKLDDEDDGEKTCLAAICEAFVHSKEHDSDYMNTIVVLSMVLEMVQHLMEYDFGYMFQEPVDVQAIPEYATVVQQPMDLGTIADRLVDGHYAKLYDAERKSWNNVIVQVIKDVERVWHNCFTFNFEGSSIYRMAEMCSRRARNIRARSFDHLLNEDVKKQIADYVQACDKLRAPIAELSAGSSALPKSKHKIRVAWAPGGKCRTIAVFDPDTNRIAKLYTTMKSAWTAAYYVNALGHATEWPSISDYTIRSCIKRGKDDPKLTLFGYRWFFVDDLKSGQVNFGQKVLNPNDNDWLLRQTDDCLIQMTDSQATYLFLSIAEAVSFSELPKDAPLADLKTRLEDGLFNEWIALVGLKWRKLRKDAKPIGLGGGASKDHAAVIKQDSLSGRRLVGFDSIEAAYQDWRHVCQTSPMVQESDPSLQVFKKDFLQGSKKVDGLVWKSMVRKEAPKKEIKQQDALAAVETALGKRPLEGVVEAPPVAKKQATVTEGTVERPPIAKKPATVAEGTVKAPPVAKKQATVTEGTVERPPIAKKPATVAEGTVKAPPVAKKQATVTEETAETPPVAKKQATVAEGTVKVPPVAKKQAKVAEGKVERAPVAKKQAKVAEGKVERAPVAKKQATVAEGKVERAPVAKKQATVAEGKVEAPSVAKKQATVAERKVEAPSVAKKQATVAEGKVEAPPVAKKQATVAEGTVEAPPVAKKQATVAEATVEAPPVAKQQATVTEGTAEAPPVVKKQARVTEATVETAPVAKEQAAMAEVSAMTERPGQGELEASTAAKDQPARTVGKSATV